ncbi:DUF7507 domain-containing protein [Anaeromicropila populeti]|uniref:Conserved repeat domain-containing protein n=1 Tax=Anaeromicropila populeti TaxID=37658 RepID=A0A1I6LU47_9FIRM|nr:DUF11 domain-containing protein [Anaeromicropila populeti]SFS06964.1 conserved repeat domain-containing protein [Anaeromicropila populeti]
MAEITNQANITFKYSANSTGSAISNIATTDLQGPITASEDSYQDTYKIGSIIDFEVQATNTGAAVLSNVSISCDLGEYTFPVGAVTSVVPLEYVPDSAFYYIDGIYQGSATVTSTAPLTFELAALASGSTFTVAYKAALTEYAPLTTGSSIKNTASIIAHNIANPVTVSTTITASEFAEVSIVKSMSPNPVMDSSTITYTFTISNYGNVAATGIELTDEFSPIPTITRIAVDNIQATAVTDYTYDTATGVLNLFAINNGASEITVPAATITQDAVTGSITVVPSTLVITVVGTI